MIDPRSTFHHARAIPTTSAGRARWPRVLEVRAESPAGRARWRVAAGPFRTARAAARAARQQRDAKGISFEWFPGALIYGYAKERGAWWVLTRPARGKPSDPRSATREEPFDFLLHEPPF